jgi:glycosyltransferase involved in cell wall biosynthesis
MSTRPRVCFIGGTRYSSPLNQTTARKFAALAEVCEAFVIAFATDRHFLRFRDSAVLYLLPAWRLSPLRYGTMAVLGTALGFWCVLRHRARILVVQSPVEVGLIGLVVKAGAMLVGVRVVLITESHGNFETDVFLDRGCSAASLYRCWVVPRVATAVLRGSDLARAVSRSTREQVLRFAPALRVFQFVAWSDGDVFHRARRRRLPVYPPEILFAGVLIPLKGIDVLIDAFHEVWLPDRRAQLVIIGRPANPTYAAALQARVTDLGLGDRVTFIGEVSQKVLALRMARAKVLVLPSYSEGLPRVVLEAMAVGTPVVATRVGGIPEVVEDGETGLLVQPGDHRALADRIAWVLEHEGEANAMASAAQRRVSEVLSASAYQAAYREMFNAAEGSREGPGA